ncbi:MAG: hypothetical protein RR704_04030 [Stenotrophomonas sp.]
MFDWLIVPYLVFLRGAGYSIHQVLEGLGWVDSVCLSPPQDAALSACWSPHEGVGLVLLVLLPVSAMIAVLSLLAAYTLGRRWLVGLLLLALLLPGLLLSIWPTLPSTLVPHEYVIGGSGVLGTAAGMIPVVVLAMLLGWALTVLMYDALELNDHFRQGYDHVWFPLALFTALFFVADTGSNRAVKQLEQETAVYQGASAYLLAQTRRLAEQCVPQQDDPACRWASDVQWLLAELSHSPPALIGSTGPATTAGFYTFAGRQMDEEAILALRQRIARYNQAVCPVEQGEGWTRPSATSNRCETPPPAFCAQFPDSAGDIVDRHFWIHTSALASECILPTLVAKRAQILALSAKVNAGERERNLRWLYFVVLAVLVGGKVANASTRMAEVDARAAEQRQRVRQLPSRIADRWRGYRS